MKTSAGKVVLLVALLVVLLVVCGVLWSRSGRHSAPVHTAPAGNTLRRTLQTAPQTIPLHPLVELDGLSQADVLALRRKSVEQSADLVDGSYTPRTAVFGSIEDGRPWWGMEGQFCHGPGPRSADGLSEESRFLVNPFLLVGLGEAVAFRNLSPCVVAYPKPVSLTYEADHAVVVYDLSGFAADVERAGRKREPHLFLHNYNARDWGYDWMTVVAASQVQAVPRSALFDKAVRLRAWLHTGKSCGQPGGCNNGSPREPNLYVDVTSLPAELELGLYRKQPSEPTPPDFRYVIRMQ